MAAHTIHTCKVFLAIFAQDNRVLLWIFLFSSCGLTFFQNYALIVICVQLLSDLYLKK